jgi:hypothetical protein
MLEMVAVAWMACVGVPPLALPWPADETAPLLVDTLDLQRFETELDFRPIDISFPRVDAHELKPFDEALALGPREFEGSDLKTPTF